MTFEELQKANETIKTTDIGKGREYAEVNQRIKAFRMLYPTGCIETDLVSLDAGVCVFRAVIKDDEMNILGTGTAYEKEGSTFINKTSYIENCETSAVGRALAMCGIGIDTSIASYEEVANAQANQAKEEPKATAQSELVKEADLRSKVMGYVTRHNMPKESIDKICKAYKIENLSDMTLQQCQHYINALKKNGGNIDD